MVDVSIIILTKNAGKRFEELMRRIHSQKFAGMFEVLVIDSGSRDPTLDIAEKHGARIFKIKPQEFHHSRTRNLGAALAQGRFLTYITQDALPVNDRWLESLITPLENDGKVAAVYGRQVAYPDAKPMEKFFYNYFYPKERKILTYKDAEDPGKFYLENVFTSDVNSAIRREVWEEIGFREDLIMAEDKDFALRALKKGWNIVYEPRACVYHSHNYSVISAFKRRFDDGVAMKQICQNMKNNYIITRGKDYFINEIKFLIKEHRKWIPYAILYNLARYLGIILGKNYEYIPRMLVKKLSRYGNSISN